MFKRAPVAISHQVVDQSAGALRIGVDLLEALLSLRGDPGSEEHVRVARARPDELDSDVGAERHIVGGLCHRERVRPIPSGADRGVRHAGESTGALRQPRRIDVRRGAARLGRVETGDVLRPSAGDAAVRPARVADAQAMGAVQARAWAAAYPELFPPGSLDPEGLAASWAAAVARASPETRHAVLVATSGSAVVGFAGLAPAEDRDLDPDIAELVLLVVDPAHQRAGHGSRLLSASVATLRDFGTAGVVTWAPAGDTALLSLLTSAGMEADGARRRLTGPGGLEILQIRLTAAIGPA